MRRAAVLGLFAASACGRLSFEPGRRELDAGTDAPIDPPAVCPEGEAACLDPTFGGGGMAVLDIGGVPNSAFGYQGVAEQADGRLVVAASAGGSGSPRAAVVRYTEAGTLDGSFGVGGVAVLASVVGGRSISVALAPDQSIVATGAAGNAGLVAWFESDGAPRSSFGGAGYVMQALGASSTAFNGIAFPPGGDVLVAGQAFYAGGNGFDLVLARWTAAGTGGYRAVRARPMDQFGSLLGIAPSGAVDTVGQTFNGSDFDGYVLRLDPATAIDTEWGEYIDARPLGTSLRFYAGMYADAGDLVAVGQLGPDAGPRDVMIARMRADTTADPQFGAQDGYAVIDLDDDASPRAVVQLADGRFVIGVRSTRADGAGHSTLAILSARGELLSTFEIPLERVNGIDWITLDARGRVVVLGDVGPDEDDIYLARVLVP